MSPAHMDWSMHYPEFFTLKNQTSTTQNLSFQKKVEFADLGCGYGGLLVALSTLFPDTLMLGKRIIPMNSLTINLFFILYILGFVQFSIIKVWKYE